MSYFFSVPRIKFDIATDNHAVMIAAYNPSVLNS